MIKEADTSFTKGINKLKCSISNISPNYFEASEYFIIAYKKYITMKFDESSYETLIKLLECYDKLHLYKNASIVIMDYIKISNDKNKNKDLLKKAIKYGQLYDGTISVYLLADLFKNLETNTEKKELINEYISEINDIYKIDFYRAYIISLLKSNELLEAINTYNILLQIFYNLDQQNNINRTILSIVILYILLNDIVSADKEYFKYIDTNFTSSEEAKIGENILNFTKNNDTVLLSIILNSCTFNSLEHQLIKLFRNHIKTINLL
jgi:hypothetical protein